MDASSLSPWLTADGTQMDFGTIPQWILTVTAVALAGVGSIIGIQYLKSYRQASQSRDYLRALQLEMRDLRDSVESSRTSTRQHRELYELERAVRLIPEEVSEHLSRSIREVLAENTVMASTAIDDREGLIREIAHSLNTPLLQIEAAALTQQANNIGSTADCERIIESVRICKAFIMAYRGLVSMTSVRDEWSPDSIGDTIESAIRIYGEKAAKTVTTTGEIPDTFAGYSNNFIVATLLPLVENAVDSSPDGGVIDIGSSEAEIIRLHVRNDFQGSGPSSECFIAGHTTKPGHEGLGLSTVTRLVRRYRGGRVTHSISGQRIEFSIELPRRVS